MKVLSVINRKGGTGKSTMSSHIAAGLATLGLNVGFIDTDSQGHASIMLGMPEENALFDVLVENKPIEQAVMVVPKERYSVTTHPSTGNLYLLPSGNKTYKIPYELDATNNPFAFSEMVEAFASAAQLDAIIVDTNPTFSLMDGAIYLATDGFIYVTECERLSFDGVAKAITETARFAKQRQRFLNRDTRLVGIIPNKMFPNTLVHRKNIAKLVERYGAAVWHPVMRRTTWVEAAQLERPIYVHAPDGNEAREAWRIVERTKGALDTWQTVASSS